MWIDGGNGMLMGIADRLTVMNILPVEGNYATLGLIRTLKKQISLTEEDFKEFRIKMDGEKYFDEETKKEVIVPEGQLHWNKKGNEGKEFEFGIKTEEIIVDSLKKLESSKKLTMNQFGVYEKFIVNKRR